MVRNIIKKKLECISLLPSVSSLPRCKYCKEGAEGCKTTCNSGKEKPACKKCIETCNRDIEIAVEEAQIEDEDANEDNEIE